MTLPLITPVSPVSGANAVSTGSSVTLRVTQLTAEALIDESSITMAVGGSNAIDVEFFGGDGDVQGGTRVFKSLLGRIFTAGDIGKSLFVTTASNARNKGKMWITGLVGPNEVTIERPALTGTASITASTNTVTGIGTLFLSEIAPGDWIVLDDDYTNPLKVASVSSDTVLSLNVPSSLGYSAASIKPIFHSNDSIMDWKLQSFAPGFNGTIKPYVSGGTAGYTIEIWPTKQLSGTSTIPQPITAIPTGTTLTGISSKYLSELHQNSKVTLAGKRTHEDPIAIASVATDDTITIAATPKVNTPVAAFRNGDLAGTPTAAATIQVVTIARDTLGQFVTVDPLPPSQPVSSYSFTTSTRPGVTFANPQLANPFGLGVRVNFSENLLGYVPGTNSPIGDKNTYSLTPINPSLPTPAITSVTVPAGNPAYVDVMLATAMANAENYKLTVKNLGVRGTSGNKVAEDPFNTIEFVGYGPVESMEIIKDTLVSPPEISGPTSVSYQTAPVTYELHNLDADVVAVQLGPHASGVEIEPGTFINNGDGTGTIQFSFSASLTSFRISVEVIDDVDNVSVESNILGVSAKAETIPGTSLLIRPQQPVQADTCARLIGDIPAGTFYLRAGFVLAYNFDPIPFTLKVLEKGLPITIAVTREGPTGKPETFYQTLIPENLTETVMLTMGRGRNLIYVTDGLHFDFIVVSATTYATVLCAIANEIYSHSQVELQEIDDAIFSPVSSRLAEPYLEIPELLPTPAVRSQQTLALKLAVRSHVSDEGSTRAVHDMATAISLQTSVPVELKNPAMVFQPAIEKVYTAQEAFGGFDMHTWFHNECVNRWTTFSKHIANSPERYYPVRITEDEILFRDQTGTTRRHLFDFSNPACSSLSSAINCFESISIRMNFFGDLVIPICAAAYPFDSCFDSAHPLGSGRATFDSVIPWDSGTPLDYDLLDPGDDGWVGFCWADRWDSGLVLQDLTQGKYTAGSAIFEDLSITFTDDDLGRWVRVTSGARQGTHKILAVIDANHVRIDYTSDITETTLTWQLVRDVHPLDSMGPAPATPIESFMNDGVTTVGSDVFSTSGQYAFTNNDIGRNLIVTNSLSGIISVIIVEVLTQNFIRVARQIGTTTAPYEFERSENDLNWEIWDTTPPRCLWDGYANKMVVVGSSDLSHQVAMNTVITLDGSATTMDTYYAPNSQATFVRNAAGPISAITTSIPVNSTVGFPTSGVLLIDSEIITYSNIVGNSFQPAVRGTNGTTAATHFGGIFTTLSSAINASVTTIPVASTGTGVSTTLTGVHNASTTTFTVASTAAFPSSGVLHVGSERVSYSGKTPTTFTGIVRGFDGTTPMAYSGGTTVFVPLFNVAGTLTVDAEQFSYAGMTSTSFTGVTRGVNTTTAASHLINASVYAVTGAPVIGITIATTPTPNLNGNAAPYGIATLTANSALQGILGPATAIGEATLTASGLVIRNAQATMIGESLLTGTGTGGTDVDTAHASMIGYGWMSGQSIADLVGNVTMIGEATISGSDLTQIHNATSNMQATATVLAVGSIS